MNRLFPFGVPYWPYWTTPSFNRPWDRLRDPADLAVDIEPWVAMLPSALVIVEVVSSTVDVPEGPADSRNIDSSVTILPSSLAIFFRNVDRCR